MIVNPPRPTGDSEDGIAYVDFSNAAGGWQGVALLDELPGGAVGVVRLTIESTRHFNPGPITSEVLRSVSPATILNSARAGVRKLVVIDRDQAEIGVDLPARGRRAAQDLARTLEDGKPKRGRKGYPDEHYRRVALAYLDLQQHGGRGILAALAARGEEWVGRSVARETARDWVHGARTRGYLSAGTPGRAGADPGPNLFTEGEEDR